MENKKYNRYNNNNNNNHYYYRNKPKAENFYGGSRSYRSNNKRFYNGRHQHSPLSLEKLFCAVVGGVSWHKVLETKNCPLTCNVTTDWEDSAVQEAYCNARKRFMAKMYREPCDIELPDPDAFIDEIDWNCNIDEELLLGLEKRDQEIPCETDKYSGVVVGLPVVPEKVGLTPMGWGDAEDPLEPSGWGDTNGFHDNGVNNAEKVCSNNGWNNDYAYHDYGVNNADKVCSNYGWNDDYVYVSHDMVHHGYNHPYRGSKWNDGHKNKRWNHGGHNKKWNNGGWNPSAENFSGCRQNGNSYGNSYNNGNSYGNSYYNGNSYGNSYNNGNSYGNSYYNGNSYGRSYHNSYGNNKRGNFSSYIQWKPKPVSSRQW